ncbi:hypothetical protein [Planosporangium mesophilum]|uniref:Uncharacterized protein n=1 Tax=Planosporangium mesophilum TaxID=689768 RepID=A0A8J3THM4_9ACTN|nr:hypothetical protein [Planosporangium mesophilum]NJC85963.1 hypothetical protein [Planosporangium mesophilum]GII25937.1 hypothetical protein Pme01_55340 [Planosporangium mesophilum]
MRARELMEQARSGQPLDDSHFGKARVTDERFEVSEEVMVGKSVRVPMSMVARIETVAEKMGSDWSKTVRRWIEEGLARDEGTEQDPAAELASAVARLHTAAERAQQLLGQRQGRAA